MAQKKVILKDGTDELLPKTSASMVFTESGQTVESALKNAGGGGTGGIDEEQLSQYLSQHKYITQTALDEANYLKPTSAITGYSKASNYTALAPTDTLNEALGKLEAGIGSGGAGGGDDTYYLPYSVAGLEAGATAKQIEAAFGGEGMLEEAARAASNRKKLYIYQDALGLIPVSASTPFVALGFFSFLYNDNGGTILKYVSASKVKVHYPGGYSLSSSLYSLTTSSPSDEISTAVGGESGLKEIIQAVKDGNRLVIRGEMEGGEEGNTLSTDVIMNSYTEKENGDLVLVYSLFGPLQGSGYYGGSLYSLQYLKSSNTFALQKLEI